MPTIARKKFLFDFRSILLESLVFDISLSRFSDLNRGPTLYERVALPLS
jgi:hypothetical protein